MADKKHATGTAWRQQAFEQDSNLIWEAIRCTAQEVLEDEMTQ